MTSLTRASVALAVLVCTPPGPASAQSDATETFDATGEIRLRASGAQTASAAFNTARVVGPLVNVTRRDDGTWGGDLLGQDLDLHLVEGKDLKVTGTNFLLVQRQSGDRTEVEGLLNGIRFRASLDSKSVTAKFGDCSMDLSRKGSIYRGTVGCIQPNSSLPHTDRIQLELLGEAGATKPPFPQFGIALVAVLPN